MILWSVIRISFASYIGFVTEEEFDLQFSDIFDQILAYQTGKPINVINPSALRDLNNG